MRTWIEINSAALSHNISVLKQLASSATIACVIKSNAYGHGLSLCAAYLEQEALVGAVCVATISEGVVARSAGFSRAILVLASHDLPYHVAAEERLEVVCFSLENARQIRAAAASCVRELVVHIKVDTGLSRLGILPREMSKMLALLTHPRIAIKGVLTHLSDKDNIHDEYVRLQMHTFATLHFAHNFTVHALSSGAIEYSRFYQTGWIRAGTNIYGFWSSDNSKVRMQRLVQDKLVPLLSWKSRLAARSSDGYGIIPVGIADGYPRALAHKADVLIEGCLARVVAVELDHLVVDVSKYSCVQGAEVTLMGPREQVNAYTLACYASIIPIELTTNINPHVPRLLVNRPINLLNEHLMRSISDHRPQSVLQHPQRPTY